MEKVRKEIIRKEGRWSIEVRGGLKPSVPLHVYTHLIILLECIYL